MYEKRELETAAGTPIEEVKRLPLLAKAEWVVNYFVAYNSGYEISTPSREAYDYAKSVGEELHMLQDTTKEHSRDRVGRDARDLITGWMVGFIFLGFLIGAFIVSLVSDYKVSEIGAGIMCIMLGLGLIVVVCGISEVQSALSDIGYNSEWKQYDLAVKRLDWVLGVQGAKFAELDKNQDAVKARKRFPGTVLYHDGSGVMRVNMEEKVANAGNVIKAEAETAETVETVKSDNSDVAESTAIVEVAESAESVKSTESDEVVEDAKTEGPSDDNSVE